MAFVTGVMSADQALSVANTWYTLTSVSLGAGTWLVTAVVQAQLTTGADSVTCDIYDGSSGTSACNRQHDYGSAVSQSLTMHKLMTLTATTTVAIRAQCANGDTVISAQSSMGGGPATTATQITAAQVYSTAADAFLEANFVLPHGDVWYGGPVLNLPAGTWLVTAMAQFSQTSDATPMIELYDGTHEYCFLEVVGLNGDSPQITVATAIVLAEAGSVLLRVAGDSGSVTAVATIAGEPSTHLTAVAV